MSEHVPSGPTSLDSYPLWVTVEEAAEILRVSDDRISDSIRTGLIPVERHGRVVRIWRDDLGRAKGEDMDLTATIRHLARLLGTNSGTVRALLHLPAEAPDTAVQAA